MVTKKTFALYLINEYCDKNNISIEQLTGSLEHHIHASAKVAIAADFLNLVPEKDEHLKKYIKSIDDKLIASPVPPAVIKSVDDDTFCGGFSKTFVTVREMLELFPD